MQRSPLQLSLVIYFFYFFHFMIQFSQNQDLFGATSMITYVISFNMTFFCIAWGSNTQTFWQSSILKEFRKG